MDQNQTITQSDPSCSARTGHISDVTVGSDFLLGDSKMRHGFSGHQLYKVWGWMKQRCNNVNDVQYKDYGGRGITVCNEWASNPKTFIEWALSHGWQKGLYLDRIDNDGNYTPDNCRLVDAGLSARNTKLLMAANSTGYRGVSTYKQSKTYRSQITINGVNIYLGSFKTKVEAAIAYDSMAVVLDDGRPTNFKWPANRRG